MASIAAPGPSSGHQRHRATPRGRGERAGREELHGEPNTTTVVGHKAVTVAAKHHPDQLAKLKHRTALTRHRLPDLDPLARLTLDHLDHVKGPVPRFATMLLAGYTDKGGIPVGDGALHGERGTRAGHRRTHGVQRDGRGAEQHANENHPTCLHVPASLNAHQRLVHD